MNEDKLKQLQIRADAKQRPTRSLWAIFLGVAGITGVALYFWWPRPTDDLRVVKGGKPVDGSEASQASGTGTGSGSTGATNQLSPRSANPKDSVLTVSGYIINRERIELSPRFMGVVKWIGVKKGDAVTNGQVVVLLDDAEYQARRLETEGRLSNAKAAEEKAELTYNRVKKLTSDNVESKQLGDDARLALDSARAVVKEIEGQLELIKTFIGWTIIKSPIDGVVLEKLVDPNELVTPQSFGGTRGPSTALIAVADPKDLQVEIDLNEQDLSKVFLNQKCRVSPEAYPDKVFEGYVAEIAPEANRQKGTLQVKVQIKNPDKYLTPELSAKVDFLGQPAAPAGK
ncbi:MAG: efflux RND transporter periplasmic adaptor subunit [Verrucomicrobia bacterium]|nr:efflux RND transporter periplasmic adaptor subunit [Verrucomicrobiota bacterium]